MHKALSPASKALIVVDLIKHLDADVKVALASYFSEITRITAHDAPYDDDQMKEVFRLIVSSFENLHDKSSRWHLKRTLILETVAKVRSYVVMLDLECDALVLEMFQHFLKTIREYLPDNVFSSMITAYSQYGDGEEALKLYLQMQAADIKPDPFVGSSLLNACANLLAYKQGKQLHVHAIKFGFMSDIFASNSLVNMYAKCGSIEDASRAFSEIQQSGIVSWSAMIGGLAQHGHGKEALKLFSQMLEDCVSPNHITLVSVLCTCNHVGLVNDGKQYFEK